MIESINISTSAAAVEAKASRMEHRALRLYAEATEIAAKREGSEASKQKAAEATDMLNSDAIAAGDLYEINKDSYYKAALADASLDGVHINTGTVQKHAANVVKQVVEEPPELPVNVGK